jgi:chloride channel 7
MIVVMISKAIGDYFTHPLYHSLIEFKCIPFLEYCLDIQFKNKKLNLDLFKVSHIMVTPVRTVNCQESVHYLANVLLDTNHGGFPVVSSEMGFDKTFVGVITRMELTVLLTRTTTFNAQELQRECRERIRISYPDYSSTKLKDVVATNMILNNFATDHHYRSIQVNLLPYVNTSAFAVSEDMSLQRGYSLFRSMGLRHLIVTDNHNQVVGIVTRKDLMAFMVVKKLKTVVNANSGQATGGRNGQQGGANNEGTSAAGTSDCS